MDSQCTSCKRIRDGRSGSNYQLGHARVTVAGHEPTVLRPLGDYSTERDCPVTGTVERSEWVYGWVVVDRSLEPVMKPMETDDRKRIREVHLIDAYYATDEPPEARVYLGADGKATFLTDRGSWPVGEVCTVFFDDAGNATQLTQVEYDAGGDVILPAGLSYASEEELGDATHPDEGVE